MEFKEKSYPYPFLSEHSIDYKTTEFNVEMTYEKIGNELTFCFSYEISNEKINQLINAGFCSVVAHFECPTTSFRKAYYFKKNYENKVKISEELLNGKVEISSFLIVTKEIINYNNSDFEEFISPYSFDFEVGTIIGVSRQYNLLINKENEELTNVTSIFKIIKIPNLDYVDFDMMGDRISIFLPEKDFNSYNLLRKQIPLQSTLSSMIIIPVLTEILSEISISYDEELENRLWFVSLEKQLKDRFKLSMMDGSLSNYSKSMFNLSQELINGATSKGIEILFKGYSEEEVY